MGVPRAEQRSHRSTVLAAKASVASHLVTRRSATRWVLAAALAALLAPVASSAHGAPAYSAPPDPRILGGTPAAGNPAVVAVASRTGDTWHSCSAALWRPRLLITAGHCVKQPHSSAPVDEVVVFPPGAPKLVYSNTGPQGASPVAVEAWWTQQGFISSDDEVPPNDFAIIQLAGDLAPAAFTRLATQAEIATWVAQQAPIDKLGYGLTGSMASAGWRPCSAAGISPNRMSVEPLRASLRPAALREDGPLTEHAPTLIQSVQRAFRLVEEISVRDGHATAKELARATNLTLSTTYHLLRTLAHEGYVARSDDGTYVLGDALMSVATRPGFAQVLSRARPAIAGMRDELKAPVYLALFEDGEVSVVEVAESPQVPGIDLWVGIHESAHATALGKAILAMLDDDVRAEYLAHHPLHQLTRRTVTDRRLLEAVISTERSVARDDGEYLPGVNCLAVPIRTDQHIGAVGVARRPGGRQSLSDAETIQILSAGAGRIARALRLPLSA